MKQTPTGRRFPSAEKDIEEAHGQHATSQTESPSYRLAFADAQFMVSDDLRGVRLMLEYLKPELRLREADIQSTVVVFGSARIGERGGAGERRDRLQRYYAEARRFGELMSMYSQSQRPHECVVMTGGGPGLMEATNRGASDAGAKNIGLNIVLPREQAPNVHTTPELTFQFHYFALRKLHFLLRARALVAFPGGFGTLDELFEALTLLQTRRLEPMPVLLFGRSYWERIVDFEAMTEFGVISKSDLALFQYVERAEQAVDIIKRHIAESSPPA